MLVAIADVSLVDAKVVGVRGRFVEVETDRGVVKAEMALAYPYEPRAGDRVLVIGNDCLYIIGVLSGRGVTKLSVPGDLTLSAAGSVRIHGSRGIYMETENFAVRATRVEVVSQAVFERFENVYRWVRGVMQTNASRVRMLVSGSHIVHAERIVERAQKDVRIDGERINLG